MRGPTADCPLLPAASLRAAQARRCPARRHREWQGRLVNGTQVPPGNVVSGCSWLWPRCCTCVVCARMPDSHPSSQPASGDCAGSRKQSPLVLPDSPSPLPRDARPWPRRGRRGDIWPRMIFPPLPGLLSPYLVQAPKALPLDGLARAVHHAGCARVGVQCSGRGGRSRHASVTPPLAR